MKVPIKQETSSSVINIALDTINQKKQALVFVNTKKSAEKTAEEISKKIKINDSELNEISKSILNSLPKSTKQCQRCSEIVKKGIAFHHAGLTSKQRELIEDNFKKGKIKVICSTPTLAAGIDLPAFRAILKDLRRYTQRGLAWIPVLEYLQMSGRAGRPNYDTKGEAIAIASTKAAKEKIEEKYINGNPEEVYSKLAVEPVLRTYVLSLISSGFVTTRVELNDFFSETFYAFQFKDLRKITSILQKILDMLEEWEFIISTGRDDFKDADEIDDETYKATLLGVKVAKLYIDPLTASNLITRMRDASDKKVNEFSFLQAICHTLELRPLLRVGIRERERIQEELMGKMHYLIDKEPSMYESEYEEFLNSAKTALMFNDWIMEKDEDFLLETYNIRPGEIRAKIEIADWLLYSTGEMCKLLHYQDIVKHIMKLRLRLKYGAKEELLTLLRLKGIGRVRARAMHRNGIKDIGDVKKVEFRTLKNILGEKTSLDVKKQVGEEQIKKEENLKQWN
tara:strand:- start:26322 stop:27854 length:1533 start_codon:yes stop_codon:yes gene_type:complete